MSISIKTPEEIEKMRVAGRLASEILDYIEPFVKAGYQLSRIEEGRLSIQAIIDLLRQRSRPYLFSNTLAPVIADVSLTVLPGATDLSVRLKDSGWGDASSPSPPGSGKRSASRPSTSRAA